LKLTKTYHWLLPNFARVPEISFQYRVAVRCGHREAWRNGEKSSNQVFPDRVTSKRNRSALTATYGTRLLWPTVCSPGRTCSPVVRRDFVHSQPVRARIGGNRAIMTKGGQGVEQEMYESTNAHRQHPAEVKDGRLRAGRLRLPPEDNSTVSCRSNFIEGAGHAWAFLFRRFSI